MFKVEAMKRMIKMAREIGESENDLEHLSSKEEQQLEDLYAFRNMAIAEGRDILMKSVGKDEVETEVMRFFELMVGSRVENIATNAKPNGDDIDENVVDRFRKMITIIRVADVMPAMTASGKAMCLLFASTVNMALYLGVSVGVQIQKERQK